jgi:hypothetical protein
VRDQLKAGFQIFWFSANCKRQRYEVISRFIPACLVGFSRKIQSQPMPNNSAKIQKRNKSRKNTKLPLDRFSEKPPRGRPRMIQPSWVRGKADNYRDILDLVWDKVSPRLLKSRNREEVIASFEGAEIGGYALDFVVHADLILKVIQDPDFPTRQRQAKIKFLADSIGALGAVTPRSSRDICERERARIRQIHQIIRYEYWIECSCGYKGHSLNHGCPKCEAQILLPGTLPISSSLMDQYLSDDT